MAQEMHVAGLSVPAGRAVRHRIEVAELADGSRISLPLLLINGASDGPRLYLGAAIHGDEASGIAILSQLCAQVQPARLAGSILCVLVQNPLAFQVEHRIPVGLYLKSPLDQMPIDPWASFPGNENPDPRVTENTLDLLHLAGLKVVIAKHRDDGDLQVAGQVLCQHLGFFRQSIVGEISTQQENIGALIDLLEQRL